MYFTTYNFEILSFPKKKLFYFQSMSMQEVVLSEYEHVPARVVLASVHPWISLLSFSLGKQANRDLHPLDDSGWKWQK